MTDQVDCKTRDVNEDQREIAEYFASERYQRLKQPSDEYSDPANRRHERLLARLDVTASSSLLAGLVGLAVIELVGGAALPIALKGVEEIFGGGRPGFLLMMVVLQSLLFPPLISFCVAAVVPMFWYGSVLVRFAMAMAVGFPGCLAFVASLELTEGHVDSNFIFSFAVLMVAQLMVTSTITLATQLWSPWTLTHARDDDSPLPPTGMQALLELMVVAAIGFTIAITVQRDDELLEMIAVFCGIAFFAAIAIVLVLIAFLRDRNRNWTFGSIVFVFAMMAAGTINGFFAVQEFGWDVLGIEMLYLTIVSLYGAGVICAVLAGCLWWLHTCGWQCVDRRQQRKRLQPSLREKGVRYQ